MILIYLDFKSFYFNNFKLIKMDIGSCCFCFSVNTGGIIIGISVCSLFLHNLVCSIVFRELILYFGVNTVLYCIVTYFFVKHIRRRWIMDRQYFLSSKMFFLSYLWSVYIVGNIWNFIFWYCMPEYLLKVCDER